MNRAGPADAVRRRLADNQTQAAFVAETDGASPSLGLWTVASTGGQPSKLSDISLALPPLSKVHAWAVYSRGPGQVNPLLIAEDPVRLHDLEHTRALASVVKAEGVRLVALDWNQALYPGGDTTLSDAATALNHLDLVRAAGAAVVVGADMDVAGKRIRSHVLYLAADFVWQVSSPGGRLVEMDPILLPPQPLEYFKFDLVAHQGAHAVIPTR